MKVILVKTNNVKDAQERMTGLQLLLHEYTPVRATVDIGRFEVITNNVRVKFFTGNVLDGIRCDIPCGFGEIGKWLTHGKDYPKLETIKDIAKYIVEKEI